MSTEGTQMAYQRTVTPLTIDLLKRDNRLSQKPLSIEERTKRALARGEKILAEARLAHRLTTRS